MSRLTREEQQKALEMAQNMVDDFDPGQAARFSGKHVDKSWFREFKLLYDLITDFVNLQPQRYEKGWGPWLKTSRDMT